MTSRAAASRPDSGDGIDPAAVGVMVRTARDAAGLTMTELARRAGVTQPYISQLERGTLTPSLATLYNLAQALGVAPTTLLPSTPGHATVVRAGKGTSIVQSDTPQSPVGRRRSSGGGHLEVFEYTFSPRFKDRTAFAHPGEEFAYVLSGTLSVILGDDPPMLLRAGDSLHFDATLPHVATAAGRVDAKFLLVSAHPYHRTDQP